MQLSLLPLDPPPCLRYFIRADGRHAGGITVHSVQGAQFSYGVAVSGDMRRRGVASSALMLLFETMKSRGFTACVVQIAPDNDASLALHRKLGAMWFLSALASLILLPRSISARPRMRRWIWG